MMIYLSNQSTKLTNADTYSIAIACDWQVRHHLQGWGQAPSYVRYLPEGAAADPGTAVIGVFDNADQAGDLGWHTEGPNGLKYGRGFVEPVLQNGGNALTDVLSVCSVVSHEVLELLFDPACNGWSDDGTGTLFAKEVADPVESDSYTINVPAQRTPTGTSDQVIATVSNFVLPAWFDPGSPAGTKLDYLNLLTKPFEVRPTGYAVTMTDGTVSQKWGEQYPEWRKEMKKSDLSRTQRRQRESHRTVEGGLKLLGGEIMDHLHHG